MKVPRDLNGRTLAKRLVALGYTVDHQTGSHIRLKTTRYGGHAITIPDHKPMRVGTLNAILRSVESHHGLDRQALLKLIE